MLLTLTIGLGLPLVCLFTVIYTPFVTWPIRGYLATMYFAYIWTVLQIAGGGNL